MSSPDIYGADGVNVPLGDLFSQRAAFLARQTWEVSPFVQVTDLARGHFRGPRGIEFVNLPKGTTFGRAADGIGTKVALIDSAYGYCAAAQDLFAMTCGDITRYGGLPLMFSNVLDVSTLGEDKDSETYKALLSLLDGLCDVALKQCVVLIAGETAELGPCVGSENPNACAKFNWAGFAEGAYHPRAMITGKDLAPGQVVVALREDGFRSNGISSVRKALALRFGEAWWDNPDASESIRRAALPSTLYDRFLIEANGWKGEGFSGRIPVAAIAHITGGGIEGKFAHDILFPMGLSAVLDNLFLPPPIMRDCAEWRGLQGDVMSDEAFYRTWNGGQGALVVMDPGYASIFISRARNHGIYAQVCGQILPSKDAPELTIHSKLNEGTTVVYRQT